jgi:hypothetical protein
LCDRTAGRNNLRRQHRSTLRTHARVVAPRPPVRLSLSVRSTCAASPAGAGWGAVLGALAPYSAPPDPDRTAHLRPDTGSDTSRDRMGPLEIRAPSMHVERAVRLRRLSLQSGLCSRCTMALDVYSEPSPDSTPHYDRGPSAALMARLTHTTRSLSVSASGWCTGMLLRRAHLRRPPSCNQRHSSSNHETRVVRWSREGDHASPATPSSGDGHSSAGGSAVSASGSCATRARRDHVVRCSTREAVEHCATGTGNECAQSR